MMTTKNKNVTFTYRRENDDCEYLLRVKIHVDAPNLPTANYIYTDVTETIQLFNHDVSTVNEGIHLVERTLLQ